MANSDGVGGGEVTPPLTLSLIALALQSFPILRPSCSLVCGDWLLDRDGTLARSLTVAGPLGPVRFTARELTTAEARC